LATTIGLLAIRIYIKMHHSIRLQKRKQIFSRFHFGYNESHSIVSSHESSLTKFRNEILAILCPTSPITTNT